MIDRHHGWNRSFKPLFIGLTFSFILLVAAFRMDVYHHLSSTVLNVATMSIAILQAAIQLIFYFHLGLESKPAWNLISFLFVILVIIIIVGGSLWIMHNLDYNVMPKEMK